MIYGHIGFDATGEQIFPEDRVKTINSDNLSEKFHLEFVAKRRDDDSIIVIFDGTELSIKEGELLVTYRCIKL